MKCKFVKKLMLFLIILTLIIPSVVLPTSAVGAFNSGKIARVTGKTPAGEFIPNPNQTHSNYKVDATDLGIMWDAGGGTIMCVFGDTFGNGWTGPGAGGPDWRSNVLAKSTDTNLADGLTFSTMIQDTPGHAKQIIYSAHDTSGTGDFTAIPTAGVTVGSRHYIHYMQIRSWDGAGRWTTNFSEIAYSDDGGQNWTKSGVKWSGTSKFAQAAYIKSGGYVYMFGTPSGRFGSVFLARVTEANMLNKASYQYWNGSSWVTNNEGAAVAIIAGPVGEISVVYNTKYQKYILGYLNEQRAEVVFRDSASLTGGWSVENVVAPATVYPGLYGCFIHPWSNTGDDLYFLMSQWDPYNVFLMRSPLNWVQDPGFESQTTSNILAPYAKEGNGGIDRGLGFAFGEKNNVWLRSETGWNCVKQTISVKANTNYTLRAMIQTSSNNQSGYLTARGANNVIINETRFYSLSNYTPVTVTFNTGSNTTITVSAGMWGMDADTWIRVDDMTVY
jgi:hypothetical protein